MTDYISKTEHYRDIAYDLERINGLSWSELTPISHQPRPTAEGVLVLYDENEKIIGVSATNDVSRRIKELLDDKEMRFNNTAYFRYVTEENSDTRFLTRTDTKHLILKIETPIEEISNVLDDDDPRIVKRNQYYREQFS